MSLLAEYSLWLLIPCLALGAIYALILYYRNRTVEYEKKPLLTMALLRGLSISLIAFLLLAPMTKLTSKKSDKPLIFFAIDNSESIVNGEDSAFYRNDYITELNQLMDAFGDQYEKNVVFIGEKNDYQQQGEKSVYPDFTDKSSNLSSIFDDISKLYAHRNVGAMVLLSDGIYNTGSNPYYKAETAEFPIFTVGLGNPESQTDLLISRVIHNRQSYQGNYFPVEIKIAAHQLAGKDATLTVYKKDKELFSKQIRIPSNSYFESIQMSIEASEKGMQHYRVTLSEVDGEVSYKNNTTSFFVEVVDTREKIALLYHAPHPDIAAVRNSLEKIDKYQLDVFPFQEFKGNSEEYSLLILHQVPALSKNTQASLNQIIKSGISTLFILGNQTDLRQFNALNLGVNITQSKDLFNNAVPVYNDNFTSFTFSEESKNILKNFPPLNTFFGEYKTAVSANTFLYQQISGVNTQYPLLVFNDINGTKTGVITGNGLWQWRMYNWVIMQNFTAFDEIINKTVQFLSVKGDKSFFRVHADQVYDENVPVEFSAELYNDSYELINEPDVQLVLTNEEGIKYDYRFSKQNRAYSLNIGKLPVGDYSWQASVQYGTKNYSKSGSFSVRELLLESVNLTADHDLLQNIALATEGKFFLPNEMQEIEKEIKNNKNIIPIVSYGKSYRMIINSWWYFALIILLLGLEWFMRKWGGGY